jgi:hypothetical protein
VFRDIGETGFVEVRGENGWFRRYRLARDLLLDSQRAARAFSVSGSTERSLVIDGLPVLHSDEGIKKEASEDFEANHSEYEQYPPYQWLRVGEAEGCRR